MSALFGFLTRSFGWLIAIIGFLVRALLITWATLAIYYSNLPWAWARLGLAVAFALFAIWSLWYSRRRSMSAAAAVLFLCVVGWWLTIAPSHHRNWRPEVAVMPRATIDGDRVRLTGVRNFDYRSRNDFTVRHEEREVRLSHLKSIDFYISYFTEGPVGHTFLSFIFDDAPPLTISIETRPEVGECFAPVASLFKQFELSAASATSWACELIIAASRRIFIASTLRLTMRAASCSSIWNGSTSSPITPSSTIC